MKKLGKIRNRYLQNMGAILHVLFHRVKDEFTRCSNWVECVLKHLDGIIVLQFKGQHRIRHNGLRFLVAEIQ